MYVRSLDAQIYYEMYGEGAPLVLLHPFPVHREFWRPIIKSLSGDYRVVLPDLRGHGNSSVGNSPATMQMHAEDISAVLRDARIERAIFGGVSIGGYVLFEFWRRHREQVKALILACTRASGETLQGKADRERSIEHVQRCGTEHFFDAMVKNVMAPQTRLNRPDIAASAREMMNSMPVEALVALQRGMAERPDSMSTLQTIKVPTLVICGAQDSLVRVGEMEQMQRMIRESKFEVLSDAGHYAIYEQPAAAGRLMRQFIDWV